MTKSMIIAGSGGQGVLFAGRLIANTAMFVNKKVTWMPEYGPAMRGGTCNCCVIVSDDEIASPVRLNPDIAVVHTVPSFHKFVPRIAPGGVAVIDSSLIADKTDRTDISVVYVDAAKIAADADIPGYGSLIMVGKMLAHTKMFTYDEIVAAVNKLEGTTRRIEDGIVTVADKNKKALKLGFEA